MYTIRTSDGGYLARTEIYDVNPSTGEVSNPVNVLVGQTIGLEMGSDDHLYTIGWYDAGGLYVEHGLFKIHPPSGTTALVGPLGLGHSYSEGDIAFDPISGELYAIFADGDLFTVDLGTGSATFIGTVPSPNGTFDDFSYLSFDLAGNLYAIDNGNSGGPSSYVVEVDPNTAAALGSVLTPDLAHPGGMDVHPVSGELYLLESDPYSLTPNPYELSILDPLTGTRTPVGPLVLDQPYSGIAMCSPPPPCTPPPPDMVAWWGFDEPAMVTGSFDLSDTAPNTGYLNGSAVLGGELTLDGGFFEVIDHPELNFDEGQDLSIDAWIQTRDTRRNQTSVDKRAYAGGPGYLLTLWKGRLLLQLADGSGYTNYWNPSSTPLNDGQKHFVAVSVDRDVATGIKFYVDGNLIDTYNPLGRNGPLLNNSVLRVGAHSFAPINRFYGNIDEVEIFNRVVSQAEFNAIYAAAESGKCKTCPAEMVLTDDLATPSDGQVLKNLRRFRNRTLAQTQTGQRYADLFAAYNFRVVWLMARDHDLRNQTATLLRKYHTTFRDLVFERANYRVSKAMIDDGQSWLRQVLDADQRYLGGSELGTAIQREMQAIDWATLDQWQVQDLLIYHD